ncbi:hypothetical protein, partial [Campylobacter troglodytis]|uniref:hypothetical protein n=1 Tax=Campylobacter troglodytis TaxID=654363 RepID=UPI00163C0C78
RNTFGCLIIAKDRIRDKNNPRLFADNILKADSSRKDELAKALSVNGAINSYLAKAQNKNALSINEVINNIEVRIINNFKSLNSKNSQATSFLVKEKEPKFKKQLELPSNLIRIETEDSSEEFIELEFVKENAEKNWIDLSLKTLDIAGNTPLPHTKILKIPKLVKAGYNGIKKVVQFGSRSLTRQEILEILSGMPKGLKLNGKPRSRIYTVKNTQELMKLWEILTRNFKKEHIQSSKKGTRITRVLDDDIEISLRNYSSKQSANTPTIDIKMGNKDYKIHIKED